MRPDARTMRVDAAEFVPSTSPQAQELPRPSKGLSASSPEFVPSAGPDGAAAAWWSQASVDAGGVDTAAGENTYGEQFGADDVLHQGAYLGQGMFDAGAYGGQHDGHLGLGGEAGLVATLLSDQDAFVDVESFLTPQPLAVDEPAPSAQPESDLATAEAVEPTTTPASPAPVGALIVEGRRLLWEVAPGWEELRQFPHGECIKSPPFSVAGVSPCQLALYPSGANLTAEGDCAVSLLCEEKAKLKFELFLNARSSGMKVLLGKSFTCDFRRPSSGRLSGASAVGIQVHENLFYAGFR